VLEVGKGTLIRLSRPASTVFVASPDIADVQIKSPELIYVSAKAPGQTVIYAVDGGDTVLLNAPVRVVFRTTSRNWWSLSPPILSRRRRPRSHPRPTVS
jgi:Flp pilus assembly secretin CpaC